MYGRNPAHYAEYWKAVQELWLRLYLSNLILVAAINVSAPTPTPTVPKGLPRSRRHFDSDIPGPDRYSREKKLGGPGPDWLE